MTSHLEDIDNNIKTVDDIFRPHIARERQQQANLEQGKNLQDAKPLDLKAHKKPEPVVEKKSKEREFAEYEEKSGWVEDLCAKSKRLYAMKDDSQYTAAIQALIANNPDFNENTIETTAKENNQYSANTLIDVIVNQKMDLEKESKNKK